MIWAWLTSRVAQIAAVLGIVLGALGLLRRDARKDEQADMKEKDRDRADEIRRRVDVVPRDVGLRPDDADDNRGYRD